MDKDEFARLASRYSKRGMWTPKEAARLLGEQYPYRPDYVADEAPETGVAWHILHLMLSFPDCRNERPPAEWVRWAVANGLYVNESLLLANQTPPVANVSTAPGSVGAVKASTAGAGGESAAPRFAVKKFALVARHKRNWPTIEANIKSASENGLAAAARAVKRDWWEENALAWARSRGKLVESQSTDPLQSAMHGFASQKPTGRVHLLKG